MLQKLVAETIKAEGYVKPKDKGECPGEGTSVHSEEEMKSTAKLKSTKDKEKGGQDRNIDIVKSPSDTTIYAPALMVNGPRNVDDRMSPQGDNDNVCFVNDISTFIESVRIGMKSKEAKQAEEQSEEGHGQETKSNDPTHQKAIVDSDRNFEQARDKAAQKILEAEQYKAQIHEPKGRCLIDNGLSDDDFFHVTCHVDSALKTKIENGEFVELDKLLPKSKYKAEGKLKLVNRNGATYFVPAESGNNKINGIRRWEQAFRVYAAIYSAANPHRAAEIWQYVYVINTAALTYSWENISIYDYTFRHLMAFNPGRSWSKIYSQGWNLCMLDTVTKFQSNNGHNSRFNNSNSASTSNSEPTSGMRKSGRNRKSDYCWDFNGPNGCGNKHCKWINKCKYCDATSHGVKNCLKLEKKEKQKSDSH